MATAQITFTGARINDQQIGSTSDHMVSRVHFTVSVGGATHEGEADIKQVVGADFGPDSVEVLGTKCDVALSYNEFRSAVEDYYRRVVGSIFGTVKVEAGTVTMFVNCTSNLEGAAAVPVAQG